MRNNNNKKKNKKSNSWNRQREHGSSVRAERHFISLVVGRPHPADTPQINESLSSIKISCLHLGIASRPCFLILMEKRFKALHPWNSALKPQPSESLFIFKINFKFKIHPSFDCLPSTAMFPKTHRQAKFLLPPSKTWIVCRPLRAGLGNGAAEDLLSQKAGLTRDL